MNFRQVVHHLSRSLLFPQLCILCEGWVSVGDPTPLCRACFLSLRPLPSRICSSCGIPLPEHLSPSQSACSACRKTVPLYDQCRSFGGYRGSLRRVIRKFKFERRQDLAQPLTELLYFCWDQGNMGDRPDWIIPIPSHPQRRRERGLDQARLLGQSLSRKLNVPLFTGLSRIKRTKPQFDLTLHKRQSNLRGAFALRESDRLLSSEILLVDDIMTTGTTIHEACRTLRDQSLVKRIWVLTVARVTLMYDYM